MKNLFILIFCLTTNAIFSQNVKIEVSPDTQVGQPFTVKIISEGGAKEVEVLDLDGLKTLGNSTSMSTTITNGKIQKSQSINLTLLAKDERDYKISVAVMEEGVMEEMIEETIKIGEASSGNNVSRDQSSQSRKSTPAKPTKPRTPRKLKRI